MQSPQVTLRACVWRTAVAALGRPALLLNSLIEGKRA